MKRTDFSRRDFNRLTMAAFGGIVAGTTIGCGGGEGGGEGDATTAGTAGSATDPTDSTDAPPAATGDGPPAAEEGDPLLTGKHVCRGMNACKGQGRGGKNECAGTSECYTANKHTCHYENECRGQGGCGETAGQNECAKKGECGVPLSNTTWEKARAALKVALEKKGKTLGDPPQPGPPDA